MGEMCAITNTETNLDRDRRVVTSWHFAIETWRALAAFESYPACNFPILFLLSFAKFIRAYLAIFEYFVIHKGAEYKKQKRVYFGTSSQFNDRDPSLENYSCMSLSGFANRITNRENVRRPIFKKGPLLS